MDTKSNGSKPFWAWFASMLGLGIIASGLFFLLPDGDVRQTLSDGYTGNFFDSGAFENAATLDFLSLTRALAFATEDSNDASDVRSILSADEDAWDALDTARSEEYAALRSEGEHLVYFAESAPDTTPALTNQRGQSYTSLLNRLTGQSAQPSQYALVMVYADGSGSAYFQGGQPNPSSSYAAYMTSLVRANLPDSPDARLIMAVPSDVNAQSTGRIASAYRSWRQSRLYLMLYAGIMTAGVLLLIWGILWRAYRRVFVANLMDFMARILIEFKLLSLMILGIIFLDLLYDLRHEPFGGIFITAFIMAFWYFLRDFMQNRSKTFKNNIPMLFVCFYRRYENKKPFQKALMSRILTLLLVESILIVLSIFFFFGSMFSGSGPVFFIAMMTSIITGLFFIFRFLRLYRALIHDIGSIIDHVQLMRGGNMDTRLSLPVDHDLYPVADGLNNIQDGLQRAINARTKSERMKVELITNVSHDLKTPLTSIISYVDLLAQDDLSPAHANDYVKVIRQKAERLDRMTKDLFELSRAQSGSMVMHFETLDLTQHLRQTMAELEEKIMQSGLVFLPTLPDQPLRIVADGTRLYRVFDNLITNAIKYSLPKTRVYLSLQAQDGYARFEIKNISAHALDFDTDEITERFTRGDSARTTEGSGLGLAIVRSFVESAGGTLSIVLDGDLFKAIVSFPLASADGMPFADSGGFPA